MTCDYLRWAITGGIPALSSTPEQRDAIAEHLEKCPRCEEFLEFRASAGPKPHQELRDAAFKLGMRDALRKKP
jgi:hypothetical protein